MWGDLIGCRPQVNLLVDIEAGDDEEDPGPPGSTLQEATQSEDDGSLVLLDDHNQRGRTPTRRQDGFFK